MEVNLTFPTRQLAEQFAIDWGRYAKTGHIISSGLENVKVTIFDVTDELKKWVDNYIDKLNKEIQKEIIYKAIDSLIDVSDKLGIYRSEISFLLARFNIEISKLEN